MASYNSYVKIGKEVSGDAAYMRRDLVETGNIALTFALVKQETGVDLWSRIIQAKGGSSLSAGTHSDGCAFDFRVWNMSNATILKVVSILRECGWSATWFRDWTGNRHIHAGANLGMSVTTKVLYQVRAVKAGYDGLKSMGRGGKDPHKAPSAWRTVQEGAVYARARLNIAGSTVAPPATTTPTAPKKEADELTPEQDALLRQINIAILGRDGIENTGATAARHVWTGTKVQRSGGAVSALQELADAKSAALAIQGQLAGLTVALQALAVGKGVDMAAVTAAAKAGVEQGLKNASVTVKLG